MEARTLGKSDLQTAPVIFGAWAAGGWYWGGTDDAATIAAINRSIDLGMKCIDTAPMYGCGHSEEVVGRAIAGRRDEVVIATKCGLRWDLEEGDYFFEDTHPASGQPMRVFRNLRAHSIMEECERSLRRLRTDRIDLYQCHWPDVSTDLDETMDALLRLKQDGKIRAIGVSNFTPEMIEKCMRRHPIASNQPKYSLLGREIEADVLPWCRAHDVASIVYSPLDQGLLTGKVTMARTFPEGDYRGDRPWFQPQNRWRVLNALQSAVAPIANKYGATLGQVVIAWTVGEPGVTAAIVGARSPAQVEENAGGLRFKLEAHERAAIRAEFEALGEPILYVITRDAGVIEQIIDDARAWAQGRMWVGRALFLVWFAWILVNHLIDPVWYQSLWKPLNLGIHELGHVVFRPFGEVMAIAGGSLLQCLAPIAAGFGFARQRDYFGIAVCLGWLSTNLFDVATYMGDSIARQLQLVSPFGGGEPIHDWEWLFDHFGVLLHCVGISRVVRLCGVVTMLAAIGFGGWLCVVMAKSAPRAFDDE